MRAKIARRAIHLVRRDPDKLDSVSIFGIRGQYIADSCRVIFCSRRSVSGDGVSCVCRQCLYVLAGTLTVTLRLCVGVPREEYGAVSPQARDKNSGSADLIRSAAAFQALLKRYVREDVGAATGIVIHLLSGPTRAARLTPATLSGQYQKRRSHARSRWAPTRSFL